MRGQGFSRSCGVVGRHALIAGLTRLSAAPMLRRDFFDLFA